MVPATWTSPSKTITDPQGIAEVVREMNRKQYQQAFKTPFGSGPLAEAIGWTGNTIVAATLLEGALPDTSTMRLLPETERILHRLSTPYPTTPSGKSFVSPEEFASTYKVANKATSSSPSSHHIGYYKAAIRDPSLETMHAAMMSLPFQVGFSPEWWKWVTNIMLEKLQGTQDVTDYALSLYLKVT
jgi:hypothetical protein